MSQIDFTQSNIAELHRRAKFSANVDSKTFTAALDALSAAMEKLAAAESANSRLAESNLQLLAENTRLVTRIAQLDDQRADADRLAEVLKQITPEANLYSIPIDLWQLGCYALNMHRKVTKP